MAVISALLVVAAVTMITASLLQRQDAFLRGVQAAQNAPRPRRCCAAA